MEDTDVNRDDILDWNQDESLLATAASGTASGADTSDVDLDGLTGDEETGDTYTNRQRWDTDGDGMPDGWEARFADTDPLMADAELAADGDLMAFAVTNGIYRLVTDAAGARYLVRDTNSAYRVGDVISTTNLVTTYDYMTVVADETGTNFVTVTYAGLGTNVLATGTFKIDTISPVSVALVHAQVYDEFGYWQSTAVDPADPLTKPFTALDKYMLARYFEAIGFTGVREEAMNVSKTWKDFTLKPLDADCDRDGVADGWELYLMFGTNGVATAQTLATPAAAEISPWKYADRDADIDGDELSLVDEYAQGRTPSDPWNKYSVYEELLAAGVVPEDADKFTDAKARRFAIAAADYDEDWDLDQISNVQEMWAYYRDMARLADIDPENPRSDGFTPDYFRMIGTNSYLGAYYNGAEFVERAARSMLDITDLRMAGTRDLYHSGWDLWSIVRYSYAKQEESGEEFSEELSVANKYTYVMFEGYEGVTEDALVKFHHDDLGHATCGSLAGVITTHGGLEQMKEEIRQRSVSALDASGFDTPEPMVKFTFRYTGFGMRDVIVDVWQTSSIYPERGEQVASSFALQPAFDAGVAYARAKFPARGTLKQGPAKFVAYIDADESGTLSPGETFGVAEANVGYSDLDLTIRLGDGNPALPTINLVANGTNDTERPIQTVAIVRTKVNGQYVSPRGVMLKRYDNNVNRTAIYPSDWINETDGFIGVDKYLAFDAQADIDPSDETLPAVEEVTYEIVKLRRSFLIDSDDGTKISNTNLNHYVYTEVVEDEETGDSSNVYHTVDQQVNEEFTLRYSVARDVPLEVTGSAASKASDTVVSFLVPADRAVTKFWLDIDGSVKGGDSDRGFLLANLVTGDVLNTAPGLTGQYTSRRVILDGDWFRENGIAFTEGEHGVRVALGNDKFPAAPTEAAEWSERAEFSVAADAVFKGMVAVRAVHPVVTNENAFTTITVAAYEQPDLANPVATATSVTNGAAVVLGGLRTGRKYYLAAWYVKDAADGRSGSSAADPKVRMPYDTWGYLTMLGEATNGFNAAAIVATEKSVPTNTIWMQDTDWNDNGVADREENLTIKSIPGFTPSEAPEWEDVDCDGIPDQDDEDPVFDNSTKSIEGDVMAKATLKMLTVRIGTVELETNWVTYVVYDPDQETATRLDGDTIVIPRGTPASALTSLYTTYLYGRKKSAPLGIGVATNLAEGVVYEHEWKDVALVHHQVYERFGFNPNTANALASPSNWVNTAKFTALDKYIVTNYLYAIGAVVDPASFTNWTLNARRVDFDYDGLTDGWELYTMFGTNAVQALDKTAKASVINAWVAGDRELDPDGDGLTNLHEYNGGFEPTDPWNKYTFDFGTPLPGGALPLTDYEARRFDIGSAEKQLADDDNDGLSNWAELLATRNGAFGEFDVKKDFTVTNQFDYFRTNGLEGVARRYAGFVVTDHDFVGDAWEDAHDLTVANRYVYDAHTDYDDNGWSLWSEATAAAMWKPEVITNTYDMGDEVYTWVYTNGVEFTGTPLPKVNLVAIGDVGDKNYSYQQVENEGTTNAVTNTVWATYPVTLKAYRGNDLGSAYRTFYVDGTVKDGVLVASFDGEGLVEGLNTFVLENGDASGFCKAMVGFDRVDLEISIDSGESVIPPRTVYGWGDAVSIRRTEINGRTCPMRYVWSGSVDGYVTAADVLKSGAIDLDARYLVEDAAAMGIANTNIASVTYEVSGWYGQTFTKTFAAKRPVAIPVSPTIGKAYTVRTRKPVFAFAGLDGATAFALQISISTNAADVFLATTNLLPAANSAGSRIFKSDWQIGEGLDLNDSSNYFWRVVGLSAKWPEVEESGASAWAEFKTSVDSTKANTGYGKIAAEVRYYGAATNDTASVIVGVWRDAAFAGTPVAMKHLAAGDFAALAVQKEESEFFKPTASVEFDGIEPGNYYVMAYNDLNGNGKRDAWESWGYKNKVGTDEPDLYAPVALTVVSTKAATPTALVFMEDTDINDNGIPDCVEDIDFCGEDPSSVSGSMDLDGDGLDESDEIWNEHLYGTDPLVWDTDGDGLPDGYEVWAGLDPVSEYDIMLTRTYADTNGVEQTYTYRTSAAENAEDGDVMAYAMIVRRALVVADAVGGETVTLVVDPADTTDYRVGGKLKAGGVTSFATAVPYATLPSADWNEYTEKEYYVLSTNVYEATDNDFVVDVVDEFEIMLMHWQVYGAFGFESGVATPGDTEKRADGQVHTRPMYGIDKYLVSALLGIEEDMNQNRRWGQGLTCLKPGVSDYDGDGRAGDESLEAVRRLHARRRRNDLDRPRLLRQGRQPPHRR